MTDRYVPPVRELLLVVPREGGHGIAPGSAVVATREEDTVACHYEGGLHQDMDWDERLTHAAGRLAHRYPTTACAWLHEDQVDVVGTASWDARAGAWTVSDITDPDALRAWRGGQDTRIGASEEQLRRAAGIELSRGGTPAIIAYQTAVVNGRDPVAAVLDQVSRP